MIIAAVACGDDVEIECRDRDALDDGSHATYQDEPNLMTAKRAEKRGEATLWRHAEAF